jgi:hypothetical protein
MGAFSKTHTNKIKYREHIGIKYSNLDRRHGKSNYETKNKSSSKFQK